MPSTARGGRYRSPSCRPGAYGPKGTRLLAVEPDVLETPVIVDRIDGDVHPLDLGMPAGGAATVRDHRTGAILLQLLVDLPHQRAPLLEVGHLRLLVHELLQLGIAVVRVVALRAAGESLVEHHIGIIDADT